VGSAGKRPRSKWKGGHLEANAGTEKTIGGVVKIRYPSEEKGGCLKCKKEITSRGKGKGTRAIRRRGTKRS